MGIGTSADESMSLPTFLVIGSGRAGTTSLHHYLQAHPQIFVPKAKAPSYFYAVDEPSTRRRPETDAYFVRDRSQYFELFTKGRHHSARGEVSPAYLCSPRVPERIASELPTVKLIAVVRNPTERLVARFVARRRDGLENLPSIAAVVDHEKRHHIDEQDSAGTYVASGFVSHVLERYLEVFGNEALTLLLYDDLKADPRLFMDRVLTAIGVDPEHIGDVHRTHNASLGEIPGGVGQIWRRSARLRTRMRPFVPRSLRDRAFRMVTSRISPVSIPTADLETLDEIYREETERLSILLGRDLSHWRRPSS